MTKKQLRKKLALMLANLKRPRKYYCEVEYLEGTGTQYIDTGLDYFADFEVGIQLRTSVSNKALGNGAFYCMQRYNQANPYWYFSTGTGTSNSYITSTPITEHHIMKWKDNKIYSDGVLLTDFTKDSNAPNRMYLYSGDGGNKYPNMIYFCKLWNPDNGELVRDFIPVLDWDMKPCLFDRVTEQLFYNQATSGDDFSYGREIHYVDYLESTGTQYIDTGYYPNLNTKVEFMASGINADSFAASASGTWFTGGRQAYQQKMFGSHYNPTNQNLYFSFSTSQNSSYYSSSSMYGDNKKFTLDKTGLYINDVKIVNNTNTTDFTSPATLAIFALNNNGTVISFTGYKLQYYKIWDNNTLLRDFIPAIDENGVGYMLDRVSHTIYDNAGTGAFGYSGREVEYLQSDGARVILAGLTVDDTCGYDVKWMALNADDTIIMGTKGAGDSRWVLSGNNNPNVNISWNTSYGGVGLGLNKIQTAQMNYFNDRKRILNDTPLADITTTLSTNASTYNVSIFAGYWGASSISLYSTCRIYYAKISKGTELIRDFIPMVKDGAPCLFDNVGGLYYFGTGPGSFTTGKIVEPEYE